MLPSDGSLAGGGFDIFQAEHHAAPTAPLAMTNALWQAGRQQVQIFPGGATGSSARPGLPSFWRALSRAARPPGSNWAACSSITPRPMGKALVVAAK